MPGYRQAEKARANYHHMAEALLTLERDLHRGRAKGAIPPEWHGIALERGPGRKTKATIWMEEDVLRFFKGMGRGHTARMAEVLRTFMHARLAGVLKGAEGVDYSPRPAPEEDAEWERRAQEQLAGIDAAFAADRASRAERMAALRAEMERREQEGRL